MTNQQISPNKRQELSRSLTYSRVLCFLKELETGKDGPPVFDNQSFNGFHPLAYGLTIEKEHLEYEIRILSGKCRELGEEITSFSLELQIWWRDNKVVEDARIMKEKAEDDAQKAIARRNLENEVRRKAGRRTVTGPPTESGMWEVGANRISDPALGPVLSDVIGEFEHEKHAWQLADYPELYAALSGLLKRAKHTYDMYKSCSGVIVRPLGRAVKDAEAVMDNIFTRSVPES